MFRASRGDHQSVLEFVTYFRGLCYSSGRAITGLSQSEDLRHLSVCREREISHREKRDGTQTSVTPESRPFQGNSTRNFCWCTPVHVLNHTSEEITIFAPKSFGQLNMRCCTILHGLTLFLRPRTSSLLTRTTVRRSKVLWMSSEVSLYECTHTHTHTHQCCVRIQIVKSESESESSSLSPSPSHHLQVRVLKSESFFFLQVTSPHRLFDISPSSKTWKQRIGAGITYSVST